MKTKLKDLPKGLQKRAKALVPHADKILYVEEYDPREDGPTYETKRHRVTFEYQGKEFTTSMTQGKNKYY